MEVIVIKSKITMLTAFLGLIILLIPVNLVGYATSDVSYKKEVDSLIDIDETNIFNEESLDNNRNKYIVTELANILNIKDNNRYNLLVNGKTSIEIKKLYGITHLEEKSINLVMLGQVNSEDEQLEQEEVNTNSNENSVVDLDKNNSSNQNALIQLDNPDTTYKGQVVKLSSADRDLLERLVMGEAGGEGYEGAALVAQTIRDHMVYHGYTSVETLRVGMQYKGSIENPPNEDVKKAVAFIFDQGGMAVQHKIYYFYAFQRSQGVWHNTQEFILQWGGHKFYCRPGE